MSLVMQAAELATIAQAQACEAELRALFDSYIEFEETDPSPWSGERVPPPLAAFGRRHGVEWPHTEESRFLLKGPFKDTAELLRVDRMVFLWGDGFDLGGPTMQEILTRLGAVAVAAEIPWGVRISHADPDARLNELTSFLEDEDFEDQFSVAKGADELEYALYTLTIEGPNDRKQLAFDDSGVQEWAFVALLPQLDGEDPSLVLEPTA